MKKILIILLLGLITLNCSKRHEPISPQTAFFESNGNPNDNSVYLVQENLQGDEVSLNIKAKNVTNVYGASIVLNYNPTIVNYITNSAVEGDFFNSDGKNTTGFLVAIKDGIESTLVIGISRERNSTMQGKSGSGKIGQIKFKAITQGETEINFDTTSNLQAFDPTVKISCTWIGGKIKCE